MDKVTGLILMPGYSLVNSIKPLRDFAATSSCGADPFIGVDLSNVTATAGPSAETGAAYNNCKDRAIDSGPVPWAIAIALWGGLVWFLFMRKG